EEHCLAARSEAYFGVDASVLSGFPTMPIFALRKSRHLAAPPSDDGCGFRVERVRPLYRGSAAQPCIEVDEGKVLPLFGREGFCRRTHAGHPIQLFVRAPLRKQA